MSFLSDLSSRVFSSEKSVSTITSPFSGEVSSWILLLTRVLREAGGEVTIERAGREGGGDAEEVIVGVFPTVLLLTADEADELLLPSPWYDLM